VAVLRNLIRIGAVDKTAGFTLDIKVDLNGKNLPNLTIAVIVARDTKKTKSNRDQKMKIGVIFIFLAGFLAVPGGQENPSTNHAAPPSVALEIGQRAPAFALPDQFGQEQSNETLKGSKGTILLFFRSADW
jgi:hypothetical protein